MSHPIPGFHAIVPAGGAGTRLWPLSRAGNPKFLLDLTGAGRSLLQGTVARLLPLTGPGGVVVVTGARHADAVGAQLVGLDSGEVIAEPSARDSMAAIGLAAAVLAKRHGDDTIVGSFAADHVIADGPEFAETITQAVAAAREGYVVTIGIAASWPSTAFGYVRSGVSLGLPDAPSASLVSGFTEKPDAETAEQYLSTGEYRWNAGMFVASAGTLLGHLRTTLPALHDGLRAIAEVWDTPERAAVLEEIWPTLTKIAIDHAIAEPVAAAGGVAVVPGNFSWDDVGDFASLAPLLPSVDGSGSRTLGDEAAVLRIDAPGAVVATTGARTVTVIGIPDVVVVDTADALLVTTRAMAQQVKLGVDGWRERGRTDLV